METENLKENIQDKENQQILTEEINPYTVENTPKQVKTSRFQASAVEKIFSVLMYVLAYIYVARDGSEGTGWYISLAVFTIGFIIAGVFANKKEKATGESLLYLGMTVITMTAIFLYDGLHLGTWQHVWEKEYRIFFLHLFAVYWIMLRSRKVTLKKTSGFFIWDGIVAFFVLPYKNIILQFLVLFHMFHSEDREKKAGKYAAIGLSIAAGMILLAIALPLLASADKNFAYLLKEVGQWVKIDISPMTLLYLWLAIPVSLYLYGLIFGSAREEASETEKRNNWVMRLEYSLKKVPDLSWIIIIAVFSVFYLAFFLLQGSYMFSAFRLKLPQGFIYSDYARRGFSEMCGVMVVNFVLYFLAIRTAKKESTGVKTAVTVLNMESILFAVIAFLKIYMYMRAYGFTPLRVQSLWLVCVLTLGSVLTTASLYFKKDLAFWWFHFSAGALFVLLLI